jgi:hypothetical protein
MRLWSIHPKYLDCKGLTALWREGLLARKVLSGKTKGYKNHPQLIRFKNQKNPVKAINSYLSFVFEESKRRCYKFNRNKIRDTSAKKISINKGQIDYEFTLLKKRLGKRDPRTYKFLLKIKNPKPHPLFIVKKGPVEGWEKCR